MSFYLRRGDLARAALAGALCHAPDNGAGSGGPGGGGSGGGGAQGATGSGGAGGAQGGGSGSDDDDAELRRTRREAQTLRARVRELEEQVQTAQSSGLSEVDKLKADLVKAQKATADAQALLRQERTRGRVSELAAAKGLDPKLAGRLLAGETLEYDDTGAPVGLERLLDKLATDFPILAQPGQAAAGAGAAQAQGTSGAAAGTGGQAAGAQAQAAAGAGGQAAGGLVGNPAAGRAGSLLTLDDIKRMTPDQINARWDDVQRVLSGTR
jgi:hypothetical protein